MNVFTPAELDYLDTRPGLARIATVGIDGTPHVAPVGWSLVADRKAIEVGGIDLTATKKFRDVARSGRAALVIDRVLPPWRPEGIEVRGRAEAVTGAEPRIRLFPERIISWGFEGASGARTVVALPAQEPDRPAAGPAFAVVRRATYDPAALAAAAAELDEFQRIHAAQRGYRGNVVVEADDGVRLTITLWASEPDAAAARTVLEPAVGRLLAPLMTGPAELVVTGPVLATDLSPALPRR